MFGFASKTDLEHLRHEVAEIKRTLDRIPELTAALENAADIYHRASARHERAKERSEKPAALVGAANVDDIRRRRGGF